MFLDTENNRQYSRSVAVCSAFLILYLSGAAGSRICSSDHLSSGGFVAGVLSANGELAERLEGVAPAGDA